MKKGYVILEIGWEYNDEYYSTGNNGDMFEAPKEVYLSKEKAEAECLKREIESFRGQSIGVYFSDGEVSLKTGVKMEQLIKFMKDNFDREYSEDNYDYSYYDIPKNATDEQIKEMMKLIDVQFHTLSEITIND